VSQAITTATYPNQHKLNYLTVLFVFAKGIFFQGPKEREKKFLKHPVYHLIGPPAYKSDPANFPKNPSEEPIKRKEGRNSFV